MPGDYPKVEHSARELTYIYYTIGCAKIVSCDQPLDYAPPHRAADIHWLRYL